MSDHATSPDPASAATPAGGRAARGERRRAETRRRLLDAAFHLMAERGVDGVAIKEITDLADVGFGSFYNHFDSKAALHVAVIEREYAAHADRLDRLVDAVEDIAEVVAISVRETLSKAQREPVWGRFLVREGLSAESLSSGLGARFLRDLRRGVASGRFSCPDPLAAFLASAGGVLAAASVPQLPAGEREFLAGGDDATDDLPERTASVVLTILGLDPEHAREIAHRTLPEPPADRG